MLRYPARNRYKRKTSNQCQKDSIDNIKRKTNRNRSSIFLNQQSIQNCLSFQSGQNLFNKANENNYTQNQNQFGLKNNTLVKKKQNKLKRTISNKKENHQQNKKLKQKQQETTENLTTNKLNCSIFKKKNQQISNSLFKDKANLLKGKTSKNVNQKQKQLQINQKNLETHDKTLTLGSSYLKSIRKNSVKIRDSNKAQKTSLFNQFFMNVAKQSTHFQEFLKQSNINTQKQAQQKQQRKTNIKQPLQHNQKQKSYKNTLQQEHQNQNSSLLTQKQLQPLQNSKIHKILKTSVIKSRKISHNQFRNSKKSQSQSRNLFQNLTQNNIIIDIDQQSSETNTIKIIDVQCLDNVSQANKQQQMRKQEIKKIQQQKQYQEQTQQLFRKLNRQIVAKAELQRFNKKSTNFYEDLRVKLIKQYELISKDYKLEDKQKDKLALLIEGCNLQKHRRVNNFYFEKKLFSGLSRPQTAGAINQASKQINNLNFVTRQRNKTIMRPQTSRSKSYLKSKSRLALQKSLNDFSDYITHTHTGNSTIFNTHNRSQSKLSQKFSELDNESIFGLTSGDMKYDLASSRTPKTFKELAAGKKKKNNQLKAEKQNLSSKFDVLLVKCQQQNQQYEQTKTKMKAFQYYCSKMDNNFQKLALRIKDYVDKL